MVLTGNCHHIADPPTPMCAVSGLGSKALGARVPPDVQRDWFIAPKAVGTKSP